MKLSSCAYMCDGWIVAPDSRMPFLPRHTQRARQPGHTVTGHHARQHGPPFLLPLRVFWFQYQSIPQSPGSFAATCPVLRHKPSLTFTRYPSPNGPLVGFSFCCHLSACFFFFDGNVILSVLVFVQTEVKLFDTVESENKEKETHWLWWSSLNLE